MKVTPEVSARIANTSWVAALAVLVLHVSIAGGVASDGLSVRLFLRDFARFAVPFFFLVSGYLLACHADEPGWWRRETVKRIRSLGVPYVTWSALFGLYLLVGAAGPELWYAHGFDVASWWREKGLVLFGLDLRQAPLMLPLWYLRTLCVLVLLSGVLAGALRRWGAGLLVGLGIAYLAYAVMVDWRPELTATAVGSLLRATFAPEALFYFATGLWLRLRGVRPGARRALPLLVAATALLIARQLFGAWVPYPIVIPFAMSAVWCAVPATPWPKTLTGLSFPVYLIHWFFVHLLAKTFFGLDTSPVAFSIAVVGVVAATAVAAWALRRLAPRAAGVLFGGR